MTDKRQELEYGITRLGDAFQEMTTSLRIYSELEDTASMILAIARFQIEFNDLIISQGTKFDSITLGKINHQMDRLRRSMPTKG